MKTVRDSLATTLMLLGIGVGAVFIAFGGLASAGGNGEIKAGVPGQGNFAATYASDRETVIVTPVSLSPIECDCSNGGVCLCGPGCQCPQPVKSDQPPESPASVDTSSADPVLLPVETGSFFKTVSSKTIVGSELIVTGDKVGEICIVKHDVSSVWMVFGPSGVVFPYVDSGGLAVVFVPRVPGEYVVFADVVVGGAIERCMTQVKIGGEVPRPGPTPNPQPGPAPEPTPNPTPTPQPGMRHVVIVTESQQTVAPYSDLLIQLRNRQVDRLASHNLIIIDRNSKSSTGQVISGLDPYIKIAPTDSAQLPHLFIVDDSTPAKVMVSQKLPKTYAEFDTLLGKAGG